MTHASVTLTVRSFVTSSSSCCVQETSKRLLQFTIPRVVAVSPQMRLIEDNPASVSLHDIYKQVRADGTCA